MMQNLKRIPNRLVIFKGFTRTDTKDAETIYIKHTPYKGKWVTGFYLAKPKNRRKKDYLDANHYIKDFTDGKEYKIIPETLCEKLSYSYNGTTQAVAEYDVIYDAHDDYLFMVVHGECGGVPNCEDYGYVGFHLVGANEKTRNVMESGVRDDILYWLDKVVYIGNYFTGHYEEEK